MTKEYINADGLVIGISEYLYEHVYKAQGFVPYTEATKATQSKKKKAEKTAEPAEPAE